ncbi:iron-sulfur cluster repair di-iron protein [Candidatus Poribacteria bacterium]|jgi:regulator of cell morphogenesis and NO signaling|nr:iron-sulfur cluster repair di-iron protein [Candidatus Poribacteria bacterium]MBT5533380.1 iron-sulfur cluster repair di-iron protein [Candidatus Poribacteria bacterium]MBT5710171.1 iron-sulfur cluster repair di-iron protein [Candidatus Poribacteria bacterium]MBT7098400.1 iron-sulfur cluster repair di-iron protein [Candidatus Poribacteria bacterium]MBT7806838.1 iron-sulfur cluster repair di-iron protein [Candidatus Poribacteria bacterium]
MATALSADTQVGVIVTHHPAAAAVFRHRRVDFCCNGRQTLATACAALSLDPEALLTEVLEAEARAEGGPAPRDWTQAPLGDLCAHIIATHHSYLRVELPRLALFIGKIAGVHGDEHPELAEIGRTFAALTADLEGHMAKEEQILFPMITSMETAAELNLSLPESHCGSVRNPIGQMEHEHEVAGGALRRMSELSDGYTVPEGGCATYRETYQRLHHFEGDLFQHIHLENNILHPRAAEFEASL